MRYSIEGFSQERAVELGLSAEDLVVLRWFVDYWPSKHMIKMMQDSKEYGFVKYSGFAEQMPIVSCSKRTIARKFQRLVDAGVLENATIRAGGTYSCYRFGRNYETLVENCTRGDKKVQPVAQECTEGLYKNVQGGCTEMCNQNTSTYKDTNTYKETKDNNTKGVCERETYQKTQIPEPAPTRKSSILHWYGRFGNVLLSDDERKQLEDEFPDKCEAYIDKLSVHMKSTGKRYASHFATLIRWLSEDEEKESGSGNPFLEILREEQEKKYGSGGDSEDFVTVEGFVP